MSAVYAAAWPKLATVDDDLGALGADIKRRMHSHGMTVEGLADLAGVKSRGTIYKVFKGEAREGTVYQVKAALDRWEAETARSDPQTELIHEEAGLVTYRLRGNFGVDVTLQGPVDNIADLEASVGRLLDRIKSEGEPPRDK